MLLAVSGTAPEEPVVSRTSGHLFEKRLIEKHIKVLLLLSSHRELADACLLSRLLGYHCRILVRIQ